jgi:hypothetical protein
MKEILFEVVVRKVVTQTIMVRSLSKDNAEYQATCQASDGDCKEILGIDSCVAVEEEMK